MNTHTPLKLSLLSIAPDLPLYHVGPSLDLGPLPALFYFALSGADSLSLDPFNQPAQYLQGRMIRIFSLTLPGHEEGLLAANALSLWAEDMRKGIDRIGLFLDQVAQAMDFIIEKKFADPKKMGVMGLSRGGWIALHAAARNANLRFVLGFAPLTQLKLLKEFASLQESPLLNQFNIESLAPLLCTRRIRFYIGNRDTRVGTQECFDFTMRLSEEAAKHGIRTPSVELFITPSIGRDGHGTSPETFREGALWIADGLER